MVRKVLLIKKYFKFNDNDGKGSYSWQPIRFKISEEKKMELIEKNEYWKAGDGNKSKYDGYKKYFIRAIVNVVCWTFVERSSEIQ